MSLTFQFHSAPKKTKPSAASDTAVVLVGEKEGFSDTAAALDSASSGALRTAVKHSRFTGKAGQLLVLYAPQGLAYRKLILLGIGNPAAWDALAAQNSGGALVPALNKEGAAHVTILLGFIPKLALPLSQAAANMAFGIALRAYRFDKYRTKEKEEDKPTLAQVTFQLEHAAQAEKLYADYATLVDAVTLTRDVVSEPANVIYPQTLAEKAKSLSRLGIKVEVLGEAEMRKLGMGALLGVGQGSERESKLLVMHWQGAKAKASPIAFVGKGVTFDTGGISIKPAGGMEEMKWDMGGAGTVIGLMQALAARKAKVNAVGVAGLVENMPDGNAQRPGDVVTSMSGQTIEVLNTDAEGRLVLADALWYTQEKFHPHTVIDLATLTGAIIVALGTSRAGLFSNNDTLAEQLTTSGKATGEELWRLPLAEVYDKQINSSIADMQNIGKDREAGSITAAQFLQRFIQDNVAWAHLDIAGVAWTSKDLDTCPKGATGYGIRLLDQLVRTHYEE